MEKKHQIEGKTLAAAMRKALAELPDPTDTVERPWHWIGQAKGYLEWAEKYLEEVCRDR